MLGGWCSAPAFLHSFPLLYEVKSRDLGKIELLIEEQTIFPCQSTRLYFYDYWHCASRRSIKDAKGLSLGGHRSGLLYSGIKMRNCPPPASYVSIKHNGAYNNNEAKAIYLQITHSCCINKRSSFCKKETIMNLSVKINIITHVHLSCIWFNMI